LAGKERKLSQQLDHLLNLDKDPDPNGERQESWQACIGISFIWN